MANNLLTIVVPCYNEEEVLPETVKELGKILNDLIGQQKINANSKLLFVNDGSKDKTWQFIKQYSQEFQYVTGIKFTRNYWSSECIVSGDEPCSKVF